MQLGQANFSINDGFGALNLTSNISAFGLAPPPLMHGKLQ